MCSELANHFDHFYVYWIQKKQSNRQVIYLYTSHLSQKIFRSVSFRSDERVSELYIIYNIYKHKHIFIKTSIAEQKSMT